MSDKILRIRVGAAVDASFNAVMREVVETTQRAKKQIANSMREGAKEGAKAYKEGAKETEEVLKSEAKTAKQLADGMAKDVTKAARDAVREKVRAEKDGMREVERDLREHNSRRRAALRDQARAERDAAREAARAAKQDDFYKVSRGGSIALRYANGAFNAGSRLAGSVLRGTGVDTSFQSQLQTATSNEYLASSIANNAWIAGGMGAKGSEKRVDDKKLLSEATDVGNATGYATSEVLGGMQQFVKLTGDLETARNSMEELGKIAKANNADFEDMMKAAAAVSKAMEGEGFKGDKSGPIAAVMRSLAGQGQMGAIEVADQAKYIAKLTAQANFFKIDPMSAGTLNKAGVTDPTGQRIAVVNALAQTARGLGGRTSPLQAMESAMAFMRDLSNPNEIKRLQKVGLNPFADEAHTRVRDPLQMILEIFRASRGKKGGVGLDKINTLVPNQRARAVALGYAQDYNALYAQAGANGIVGEDEKHKFAMKALTEEFQKNLAVTQSGASINEKFNRNMEKSASQATVLNNEFGRMAGEIKDALLPTISGMVTIMKEWAPYMSSAVEAYKKFAGITEASDNAAGDAAEGKAYSLTKRLHTGLGAGEVNAQDVTDAENTIGSLEKAIKSRQTNVDDRKNKGLSGAAYSEFVGGNVEKAAKLDSGMTENLLAIKQMTEKLDNLKGYVDRVHDLSGQHVLRVKPNGSIDVNVTNLPTPGARPATSGVAGADADVPPPP